jgi:hypothetical protein
MPKFIDILKLIIEKHLMPAIVSIAITILCVSFFPNILNISAKVGMIWYGILMFCICFSIIQLLIFLNKKRKFLLEKNKIKRKNEKFYIKQEKEAFENLWNFVDSLSLQDKKYIKMFLDTNNAPIEIESVFIDSELLNNRDLVNCTEITSDQTFESIKNTKLNRNKILTEKGIRGIIFTSPKKIYKLKDAFFDMLKYSKENYGKISHFDLENEIKDGDT